MMKQVREFYETMNKTRKNPGKGGLRKSRYRNDWVDAVHFNNNFMLLCHVGAADPKHTTVREDVTCRYCIAKLQKVKHVID